MPAPRNSKRSLASQSSEATAAEPTHTAGSAEESNGGVSDGVLVGAVLAGDVASFAPIVRRYQSALLRFAQSRLGQRELAEDAVQETFINAFKSLHTYDSRYRFQTWLWTILLNQCRQSYGRRRRQEEAEDHVREQAEVDQSWIESKSRHCQLTQQENRDRLEKFLVGLPEAQADALRLRFFGELKFQEIADTMGCSLSSAKIRVRRGLLTLSEWIKPQLDDES